MLRHLGFIDTRHFTTYLLARLQKKLDADGEIALRIPGADGREESVNAPVLKEWNSGRTLIAKLKNQAAPFFGDKPVTFGNIRVVQIGVNEAREWTVESGEYAEAHHRVVVGLVPSPGAWLYSGGDGLVLAVGAIVLAGHRVLHSEVNFGPCSAIRLEADIRRPDAP